MTEPRVLAASMPFSTAGSFGKPVSGVVDFGNFPMGSSTPIVARRNRSPEQQQHQQYAGNRYSAVGGGFYAEDAGGGGAMERRGSAEAMRHGSSCDDGCCSCSCGCCWCSSCYGDGWGNWCAKCATSCSRVLLVVPNLLFMLIGAVIASVGLAMTLDGTLVKPNDLLAQLPGGPLIAYLDEQYASWAVLVLGFSVLLLSFVGCCGACTESTGFLCFYSALLIILICVEVIGCTVFGATLRQIESSIQSLTRDRVQHLYHGSGEYRFPISENDTVPLDSNNAFTTTWDKMQNELSCCGASGPEDFRSSVWRNATRKHAVDPPVAVPPSCCDVHRQHPPEMTSVLTRSTTEPTTWSLGDCQRAAFDRWHNRNSTGSPSTKLNDVITRHDVSNRLRTQGCVQVIFRMFNRNALAFLGIVIGIVLIQVVNVALSCVLVRLIRKERAIQQSDPWENEIDFY